MQKITWILKNELLSGLLSLYFPLWTSSLSRSHFPLILNCVSCYWFSSDFSRWFYNAFDVDIFPIRFGKLLPFFPFFQSFYYLLFETRVPLFSSWEIPFPHLFMFAFFIFLSKWRYECETCVAGAKKYNNTFNFEANKWHAFTISMILVSLNRNNLKTFFALFHPFLYRIQFEPTNTFVCFRT